MSVLLRLSREKFSFDTVNNGAAIYRIMLGWLFAAAAIFLVKGGIVTIFKVPETTLAQWFFWGSLGFLAGFNERWATSLISREPPKESETESNPDPENNDPAHSKRAADDNHVDGAAAEVKLVKDTPATQPDAPNEPFRRGSPRSVVRYALLFRRSQ